MIYQLEEGKLEGVYSDEIFFSNLVQSEHGFRFDMTTVTCGKIYFLASDERRGKVKKDFNGVKAYFGTS
ncbi:hypothetical protein RSJ42_06025 [Methanosarcina hadiensis]|uniref:hypothetical protein n=1 Tax=Methanosarcina hadiensis TaxID=3078083 RepID=UPI0039776D66